MVKEVANKTSLENFVKSVRAQCSINFPLIASDLGLSWDRIKKEIDKDGWFKEELSLALEEIKHDICDAILKAAIHGKSGAGRGDLTSAKWVIGVINSGALLGGDTEEGGGGGLSDGELKALGLDNE
jgi:hypothetical protein